MFDLWRAERKRRETDMRFMPRLAQVKREGDVAKVDEMLSDYAYERDLIDDIVDSITTRRLKRGAIKFDLPVPEVETDAWRTNPTTGGVYLSDKGRVEIRTLLRREKRERFEEWSRWTVLIIGLLGALTGLAAIMLQFVQK